MSRYYINRSKSKGKVPGSLVFIGDKKIENLKFSAVSYSEEHFEYLFRNNEIPDFESIKKSPENVWFNIDGLHDIEQMKEVQQQFDLHPLLMEDILNTGQRPKKENFENTLLISMKMLQLKNGEINTEQISFVLKKNTLISFQERIGDLFDPVRERLKLSKGRIRTLGVDYLCYALMDTIVDQYFDIIGQIGDKVEDLEDRILQNPDKNLAHDIYKYKREFRLLHKAIIPVRDILLKILREEDTFFSKETESFLRDLLDLTQQSMDSVENYRDLLSDYHNTYNTAISNRMNDIMRVLTVFASIFIPLTFIAGVYGTNFDYIPELSYPYSYFIMWGFFIITIIVMIIIFKRKKWL